MDLIYSHPGAGSIYQCGAGEIPGTPHPWHYNWHKEGVFPAVERAQINANITGELKKAKIDLLVLAGEYQPKFSNATFEVLSCPFDDDFDISEHKANLLVKQLKPIAEKISTFLINGKNVLSTCWAGKNRSGLITGLSLKMLKDQDGKPLFRGEEIIKLIRQRSDTCLCNPIFYDLVLYNTWED